MHDLTAILGNLAKLKPKFDLKIVLGNLAELKLKYDLKMILSRKSNGIEAKI